MTVDEIREAIEALPRVERGELIDSLVPKRATISLQRLQELFAEARETLESEETEWVNWDDVKGERPVA